MGESSPPPSRVGRFEILNRLAVGGMAEVFLAVERGVRGLERLVVVKRILPHLAIQANFVEMFVREAKFIAGINHPNIVQIHEFGEEDGAFYMVMEYVAGVSLMEIMRAAHKAGIPVPIDVACSIAAQVCAGLHAAHELRDANGHPLGLVHRDVSPHNIMVTTEGHVKLLDFGIAKATELGVDYTQTGTVKGKVHYMSPEQCKQEPVDRRTDVFALGIILWELVTGRRLFKRKSELLTMQAVVSGDVQHPSYFRSDLPSSLANAILAALESDVRLRTPTAKDFQWQIERAAELSDLKVSSDVVRPYVGALAGERVRATKASVKMALEQTLALTAEEADTRISKTPSLGRQTQSRSRDAPGFWSGPPLQPTRTDEAAWPRTPASGLHGGAAGPGDATIPQIPSLTPSASSSRSGLRQETEKRRWSRKWPLFGVFIGVFVAAFLSTHVPWKRVLPHRTSGPPIKVGFAPIMDPARLLEDLEPLRSYLERSTGRPVEFQVASSYGALSQMLLAGAVSYASLPPYTYLKTKAKDSKIEAVALKLLDGSWGSDGILLVPEQTVDTLAELKGKVWCVPDERSTTGFILPRRSFQRAGINPETDLIKRKTGNHLQSLRDINNGLCDVVGTYSGVFLNAEAAGIPVARLRTLEITGRAPADAIVAGPKVDAKDVAKLRDALLRFSPKEEVGEEALGAVERISGFGKASDAQYDGLRAAIQGIDLGALEED